ncbi:MAG TPA: ABC transporter substrate-binding protein [Planctomycetota bacterium]|nr:ABC transporter substrate-binding protein [Planctomycetota bacterium]
MSRSFVLALALALVPSACGDAAAPGGGAVQALAEAPPAPDARRVLPASARGIEFLADLIGPERIAGLPEQGFEYATLGAAEEEWGALPRFTTYLAEPVLALDPDLVLCDPWQSVDTNQRLAEAGVRVVLVPDTVSWGDGVRVLEELGRVLGVEARAAEVAADLERRVAALAERTAARGPLRALCYSNFGSQGFSAGSDTTIDEILRLAGLVNAAAQAGRRGHVTLSFEELIRLDPDVIVVSTPLHTDVGHAGDRGGASRGVLESEPSLAGLRAVRERRIVGLPPGLFACASQRVVDAAEVLVGELERLESEAGR